MADNIQSDLTTSDKTGSTCLSVAQRNTTPRFSTVDSRPPQAAMTTVRIHRAKALSAQLARMPNPVFLSLGSGS